MKFTDQRFKQVIKPSLSSCSISSHKSEVTNLAVKTKDVLKQWPWLFNTMQKIIGPAFSPGSNFNINNIIKDFFECGSLKDKIILNLGSGTKVVNSEIVNVDLYPYKNVDIVGNVNDLPFYNNTCDVVILDSVLEHLGDPELAIKEIFRILKNNGLFIITVPFMYPYHSSPDDFKRWTIDGIKHDLKGFETIKSGVRGGPAATLQGVLMHILALIFSFGSSYVYFFMSQVFMFLLSPLKLLDVILIHIPNAHEVSSDVFVIARKNQ